MNKEKTLPYYILFILTYTFVRTDLFVQLRLLLQDRELEGI